MTVNTDTSTAAYTGNGSTAIFSVPFYFLVDTDLKVSKLTVAGVSSVLVLNSDYTVTGAGVEAGGSITTIPTLSTGDKIFIERNVDAVQQTEYPVNSAFPSASHERALDRLTMLAQQVIAKLTFGLFRDPLADTYDVGGGTLTNAADGVNGQDLVTLGQMDVAIAGAVTGVLPASIVRFDDLGYTVLGTRADAVAATVPAALAALRTTGYAVDGDGGGALYRRSASVPAHPGYFQSADGAYWEIAERVIVPMMLGASATVTADSYTAITNAISAAIGTGAEVRFDRSYGIATSLSIPANAGITSRRGIDLRPVSGCANGVLMAAGNHVGRCELPNLVNFTGIALDVRCSLATIYVQQITGSAKAVRFTAGSGGVAGNVLDSVVLFDSISACTQAVEWYCETTACIIQGTEVRGNFITGGTINGALFSGAAGFVDGQVLDALAIDFTVAGGYLMNNTTGTSIPRFTLRVRSWLGGNGWSAGTPTQFVNNNFDNAVIDVVNAIGFSQTNFARNILRGSTINFRSKTSLSQAIQLVNSPGLAGFNGGVMQYRDQWVGVITLGASLAAGATTTFYFYHVLVDGNYPLWQINVYNVSAPGLVIDYVRDQTGTEDGRVAVLVRNSTGSSIASGANIGFMVNRL